MPPIDFSAEPDGPLRSDATVELDPPSDHLDRPVDTATARHATVDRRRTRPDRLDQVALWQPADTVVGSFQLLPVRVDSDLALLTYWMNDPAVAAFWHLDGPERITEAHLRRQIDGGDSVPCLGLLDGVPMSYWEVYRADLDGIAQHYPAQPDDTGLHLLIGGASDRGRGLGSMLLRTVVELVFDHRPRCGRVVAEPALQNHPSIAAFLSAGFRFSAELELPDKRAALLIRDRPYRRFR